MTRALKVRFEMHWAQRSPSGTMHGSSACAANEIPGMLRRRWACVMHLALGTCS